MQKTTTTTTKETPQNLNHFCPHSSTTQTGPFFDESWSQPEGFGLIYGFLSAQKHRNKGQSAKRHQRNMSALGSGSVARNVI